jgi:hypothetical protein
VLGIVILSFGVRWRSVDIYAHYHVAMLPTAGSCEMIDSVTGSIAL